MTAVMVEMRAPVLRLVCTKCGAAGSAGCNHGVEFLVKASDRALLEAQKNPGLSNRERAKLAGVSKSTMHRASSVVPNGTTERVTGKDGKKYKARKPPRRKPLPAKTVENSVDPLFLKISELAAMMDQQSAQAFIDRSQQDFDRGRGYDRAYVERLEFVRDWLNKLIEGEKKFVVTCSTP